MRYLVEKFMPGFYREQVKMINAEFIERYCSSIDGNPVAVYCIKPDEISAKENRAAPDELFKLGETL